MEVLILSDDVKNVLSQYADTVFWSKMCHAGKYPLVSKLALLSIPVSNAGCERIFSMVILKKTEKKRSQKQ